MNAISVALPSTYHQFTRGTGWTTIGQIASDQPTRSSNHAHAPLSSFIRTSRLADRHGAGQHLDAAVLDPHVVARQRPRRRPGGDPPVAVEHPAVARAEKDLRLGLPVDRAGQVGAV